MSEKWTSKFAWNADRARKGIKAWFTDLPEGSKVQVDVKDRVVLSAVIRDGEGNEIMAIEGLQCSAESYIDDWKVIDETIDQLSPKTDETESDEDEADEVE